MKFFFCLFICVPSLYASTHPVKVGDTTVTIKQIKQGKGKAFVHLHQNETTALRAAKYVVGHEGGSYLTLIHPGKRNILFKIHHKRYEFDPNRIFTSAGIKQTLKQNSHYTLEAGREVKKLADNIKKLLPKNKKIVAVHNNQTFSLKNYFKGHDHAHDAKALHVNKRTHYRNFYIVTKKSDYLRLKRLKFNSILQSNSAKDDGSLSVFLSKANYVNVESGYDQLRVQINMLKYA